MKAVLARGWKLKEGKERRDGGTEERRSSEGVPDDARDPRF